MSTADRPTPILDEIRAAMRLNAKRDEPPVAVLLHHRMRPHVLLEATPDTYILTPREHIHGLPVTWCDHGAAIALRVKQGDVRIVRWKAPD